MSAPARIRTSASQRGNAGPLVASGNAHRPANRFRQTRPPDALNPAIALEQAIAETRSRQALFLVMANRARAIAGGRQVFVFAGSHAPRIVAVSGLPDVNRRSPLVQDFERLIAVLMSAGELGSPRRFALGAASTGVAPTLQTYPFANLLWTPIEGEDGKPAAGVLYANIERWSGPQVDFLTSAASAYRDRLRALSLPEKGALRMPKFAWRANRRKTVAVAALSIAIGLCAPTTMTVSAPFKVVSQNHLIVSAPVEGVIEAVLVKPGDAVVAGQTLARFADTARRNEVAIAQREVDLSQAVFRRASQLSFEDDEGRRQLAPTLADVAIKRARLQLAQEQSLRATVTAETSGIAIFSDEKSLTGRPFSIGERILDIADPGRIEFEIALDIGDSIALEKGAPARLFPDSSPLRSYEARLTQLSYEAEPDAYGGLSYRLVAMPKGGTHPALKLGTSGTAKIYGRTVPLAFYLFRRPVTAVRQWLGV